MNLLIKQKVRNIHKFCTNYMIKHLHSCINVEWWSLWCQGLKKDQTESDLNQKKIPTQSNEGTFKRHKIPHDMKGDEVEDIPSQ